MKVARWLLALAALAGVAAIATACGGDDDSSKGLTKVTVMLDWTPNTNHAGLFIAKEKGYFKDQGLDVTIVAPAGGGVEQVVGAGKADFGVSVQEQVIPARAQGIPVVSIGAIIQHNTSSLMSLASDNIKRPKDLAGKTYGGFGGALETALIKKLVSCDGGDPNAVKFVEVGDVDYLVGMEQDKFDFAWIFDGWDGVRATQIENKQVNFIPFIQYSQCIPDWYTPLLITNEDMIAKQPDTVRKFMAAVSKGYEMAITSPQTSADAIVKNAPETDSKLLTLSAEYLATRYVDRGRQWGLQDNDIWVNFEKFVRESGLTEKAIDVKKAYTNEFLPKK
ncbi:MAG: ABC transporter substrate-binding protein [Chloroflexi bacterium]|nr:ABC transporter substrate-binding protein [Chloroflexota bacterium]